MYKEKIHSAGFQLFCPVHCIHVLNIKHHIQGVSRCAVLSHRVVGMFPPQLMKQRLKMQLDYSVKVMDAGKIAD